IGSKLIDFIEESASSIGSARLVLDVASKNESARRLYDRRGMKIEAQWPKRLKILPFQILRMTKTL
ncbi:MAG: GNAT family N-acetyltransferase, partial [Nitrospirota bacterium]|nr:GNAT family N-acetyltransferase [Nitrospirota bacterium]